MNIAVLIKQVPVSSNVAVDPVTHTLVRDSDVGMVNPADLNALEMAIQLKEQHDGTVTVFTMGPMDAKQSLDNALSMGCDEACHISDRAFASGDTMATAKVLAKSITVLVPATTIGRSVRPKICISLGVSGAIQHTEGLKDVKLMIAINKDGDAPIFNISDYGAVAYKCFVSTCGFDVEGDFKNVDDYALYKGMVELKELNQTLSIHCENAMVCDKLGREAVEAGKKDMASYLDSRPIFTEVEAVRRVLYFGKVTGCTLHFVHLSSAEAVEEVVQARNQGMDVTVESCVHYLAMNREDCIRLGAIAKCSPPVRNQEEVEKLWVQLKRGNIDILTSDHSPAPPEMKSNPDNDIFKAWGGMSAAQNVLDVIFDEAVQKRGMDVCQLMKVLSTNPAKIFSLKEKGEIALGKDGDIVLLKPNSPYVLKAEDLEYRHKHSPYVDRTIGARVVKTILRGVCVYDMEQGVAEKPTGHFVKKTK